MVIENVYISGFKAALRGMRNPLNSWDESDTKFIRKQSEEIITHKVKGMKNEILCDMIVQTYIWEKGKSYFDTDMITLIGSKDFKLAKQLATAGPDHGKFTRFINVTFDLTASMDFWKQFDTYKVGTVSNSCSTMHRITKDKLSLLNFSSTNLREEDIKLLDKIVKHCNKIIDNKELSDLQKTKIISKILPQGYEQKRTIQINYQVLYNMYKQRKGHKLDEWRYFCNTFILELPYFNDLFSINN